MNAAGDRYLSERVLTASPAELTAMLYDAAVGACRAAERLQSAGEWVAAVPRLLKAQRVVLELRSTLNPQAGELARNLDRLYAYCHERMVAANHERSVAATRDAIAVLEPLQQAWREACCTLAA